MIPVGPDTCSLILCVKHLVLLLAIGEPLDRGAVLLAAFVAAFVPRFAGRIFLCSATCEGTVFLAEFIVEPVLETKICGRY